MKCRTLAAAITRYGAIDLASGHWADQSKWITMLDVPAGWFPNWTVLDTKVPVTHIACNRDFAAVLRGVFNEIRYQNLTRELKTYDGCFNIRPVRGVPTAISTHAYGLGIDLNAALEPMGRTYTSWTPGFIEAFKKYDVDWGGTFKSRPDNMHFSFGWE